MALGQSGQAKLNRVKHTTHLVLVLVLSKGTIAREWGGSNHKSVRVFKKFYERMRAARVRKAKQGRAEQGDCGNPKKNPALSFPSYLSFLPSLLPYFLLASQLDVGRGES